MVLSSFCNRNIKYISDKEQEKQPKKRENRNNQDKGRVSIDCSAKNDINEKENKQEVILIQVQEINYEKIFTEILDLFKNDDIDLINSYDLARALSQDCIEYFWKKVYLNEDKNKYPVEKYDTSVDRFIKEKNLSEDFYPYFHVNNIMMDILEKAKNYISIKKKFSLYVEYSENIEPKGIHKEALNEIYSKIKKMDKSFDGKIIFFKKFEREEKNFCYVDNNKINFSALKLNEDINNSWKFWIFVKILQFLKVKIEDNYQFINNVFEDKENYPFNESGAVI